MQEDKANTIDAAATSNISSNNSSNNIIDNQKNMTSPTPRNARSSTKRKDEMRQVYLLLDLITALLLTPLYSHEKRLEDTFLGTTLSSCASTSSE